MSNPSPARSSRRSNPRLRRAAPITAEALHGELRQLAEIRARFRPVPAPEARALFASHDETSCRDKGKLTSSPDSFSIAMSWARAYGANTSDPAVARVHTLVRYFLDCLTALGMAMAGRPAHGGPSSVAALDDAVHAGDKLITRTERRARAAAGTRPGPRADLDRALTPPAGFDPHVARLNGLAGMLAEWLADNSHEALPLAAHGLTRETVTALRAAATAIDDAIAARPAPGQPDRDTPAINVAEGRLYFVMRSLWDDLGEAREDGLTSLQLPVSPALLRGLNLNARRHAGAAAGAGGTPTGAAGTPTR